jgi:hypothetical protein
MNPAEPSMDTARLQDLGAVIGRILPDGRELCVIPRIYNTIITIGPPDSYFYDDCW